MYIFIVIKKHKPATLKSWVNANLPLWIKDRSWWTLEVTAEASMALVKNRFILRIGVHAVGLVGAVKAGTRRLRITRRPHRGSVRVKVADVLLLVEDEAVRTGELVGESAAVALVVHVRVLRVDDVLALLVALADGRVRRSNGRHGGRPGVDGRWSCLVVGVRRGGRWLTLVGGRWVSARLTVGCWMSAWLTLVGHWARWSGSRMGGGMGRLSIRCKGYLKY